MRVLFYNWVDYLDDEARGGGVSVYLRNLMHAYGRDAAFLSSGLSFDLLKTSPRWEAVRHGPHEQRKNRFEIVNSGVISPGHHSFGSPHQVSHPPTTDAFSRFLTETGPYDVVHFQNLEGLPAEALQTARAHGAVVVLSLHNYYPICPQVNLWQNEQKTCRDFEQGKACEGCVPVLHPASHLRLANGLAWHLKTLGLRPGQVLFDLIFKNAMRLGRRLPRRKKPSIHQKTSAQNVSERFGARRESIVDLINQNCDVVLCVSDAVRKLAMTFGIDEGVMRTDYIGTRQAEVFQKTKPRKRSNAHLTLAYLGYMRRDKGFFFLLDTLETLPDQVLTRLSLVLAARTGDADTMTRLSNLRRRMHSLHHEDGYTHKDLDRILSMVDIGIVPVLWHDNLPQVAIEMHARHIPLLTSDMGGARELGNCPDMVFEAGNSEQFIDRLKALVDDSVDLNDYWSNARPPVDMQTHVASLTGIYSELLSRRSATKGAECHGTDTVES